MKLRNSVFLALSLAGATLLSGCNVADETTAHQKSTLFGLYTYEPACYTPSSPISMTVRTDDACGMELPSGDRTQFLWGLISIEDY